MNTYGPLFDKHLSKPYIHVNVDGSSEVRRDVLATGEAMRDQGINQVSEHNENWMEKALELATDYVRFPTNETLTGEDIRFHVQEYAGDPSHPNAYGALINTLIKRKIIVPTGEHRKMKDSRSHARSTPVYRAR